MMRFCCLGKGALRFNKALFFLPLLILLLTGQSFAIQIDLNDFYADPTVTVSADGSSALMEEDAMFSIVILSNDPGLGDPNVVIPNVDILLLFDYDFIEGPGSDDEFSAFVLDGITGIPVGPPFEFFVQDSASGTISFDLTPLFGQTLGLQFELAALSGDSDLLSTVNISNVSLDPGTPIPEPGTLTLLGVGLLCLASFSRKKVKG